MALKAITAAFTLIVSDWFAEKEELRKSASVVHETEKAILLDINGKTCDCLDYTARTEAKG